MLRLSDIGERVSLSLLKEGMWKGPGHAALDTPWCKLTQAASGVWVSLLSCSHLMIHCNEFRHHSPQVMGQSKAQVAAVVRKPEGSLLWMERQGMASLPCCTLLPLCNFKTLARQKVRMEIYVGK